MTASEISRPTDAPPLPAEPPFSGETVNYDLNGNALAVNAFALTYDVENRLATATSGTAVESYLYDESNHRVEKTIGSSDYLYFYGPGGRLLTILQLWAGTTSLVANRMYFGGLLLGSAGPGVWNDVSTMTDRLGTAVTGYPYGTDIGSTSASNDQPDFATYTKDATTGFEYANQRYYSAGLGRFISLDRKTSSAALGVPSSWNRYSYSLNDPPNISDPSGLDVVCVGSSPDGYTSTSSNNSGQGEYCYSNVYDASAASGPPDPDSQVDGSDDSDQGAAGSLVDSTPMGTATPVKDTLANILAGVFGRAVLIGILFPTSTSASDVWPPTLNPMEEITKNGSIWRQVGSPANLDWEADCPPGSKRHYQHLHYDPDHFTKGSHWDYTDCNGYSWTVYPNGTVVPAKPGNQVN